MGACLSSDSVPADQNVKTPAKPEQSLKPEQPVAVANATEKPKPQIFAIMRNGHEVIRGGMIEVQTALDKDDISAAKEAWDKLMKFQLLHARMEEGNGNDETPLGFFKILDREADGVVTKEGLYNLHTELDKLEQNVQNAMSASDLAKAKEIYPEFSGQNEAHLKKEEAVMMPNIKKMMMAKKPLKKFMCTEILPLVTETPDFEFFVKYANEILEKHSGGMPRARVFDHALWAASTPEQWTKWNSWIKETLSEKTYMELEAVLP